VAALVAVLLARVVQPRQQARPQLAFRQAGLVQEKVMLVPKVLLVVVTVLFHMVQAAVNQVAQLALQIRNRYPRLVNRNKVLVRKGSLAQSVSPPTKTSTTIDEASFSFFSKYVVSYKLKGISLIDYETLWQNRRNISNIFLSYMKKNSNQESRAKKRLF
jgi:hypothetical protein